MPSECLIRVGHSVKVALLCNALALSSVTVVGHDAGITVDFFVFKLVHS